MANWKKVRSKVWQSGLAVLSALLLVSANTAVDVSTSTAYAATGPVTLSGTAGNAQVTLNWAPVTDATGYYVYRNGTKLTSTAVTDTTYIDTTVINGTKYSYTVSAIIGTTTSDPSNAVNLLPKSAPGLLRGLASTTGVTNLTDGDNSTFTLLNENASQTYILPTPATVTGLNSYGNASYIRIKLYDKAGTLVGSYAPSGAPVNAFTALNFQHVSKVVVTDTSLSSTANMYDLDLTGTPDVNTTPTGFAATPGNAQVSLAWDSLPGVTQFNLYKNGVQPSNKVNTSPITDTSFTDTNVINGNTYSYYLAPITASGEGLVSAVSALPKSPTGLLRGLASTTGVTNLTDGDNSTFTLLNENASQTYILPTPATVTGLNSYGNASYIRIKLYDKAGTLVGSYAPSGAPVNAFTALNFQHVFKVVVTDTSLSFTANMYDLDLTGTPDVNTIPTGFAATPGNAQVSLAWDSLPGVTQFNLYKNGVQPSNKINTSPITDTSFTDTNVINGNTYSYYLAPITPSGEGLVSAVSALPKSPAGLLRGLASTTGLTKLTDGDNATFFLLNENASQTYLLPTPATVTGLNSYGNAAYIRIKLYDKAGTLLGSYAPSNSPVNAFTALNVQHVAKVVVTDTSLSFTANMYDLDLTGTPDTYPPNAPVDLTGKAGDAQATLTWSTSAFATGYNIFRDGVKVNTSPLTDTTFSDTGLVNGTDYAYFITAFNNAGESTPSNVVHVIPESNTPTPVAPSDLTGTAGDAQVALTWTAPNGAMSYNVYRDGLQINTAPVTSTTFVDTNLTNGTSYSYYVTAVNASGESGASNTISLMPMTPSSNLLINPSFENGTASDTPGLQVGKNWTPYIPTGASPNLAVVTSPVYSGTYAQKVSGTGIPIGSAIDIYQSVAALPNTAYTVSGMYNIESLNNAFVQLYVDFYDANGHFITSNSVKYGVTAPSYMLLTDNNAEPGYMLMANNLTTPGYVKLTNSFTTPENTASFRLYAVLRASAANASGTFYVDDLSVIQN
ncbi:hypothetical protein JJB07_14410 [Tumebacillus sp. ITR2]|uniref:Fibronectin type-III domain-containing protein n=1 Tax=Tumebacillus amylolyticus TaxID=2801339 RepID=A0ABS1JC94_9BACL|nr:hypothetical protein [Tumebacillus amylolyticus]MBL0387830.1 hypothetical protein [Tumebacillus amylolyticus]